LSMPKHNIVSIISAPGTYIFFSQNANDCHTFSISHFCAKHLTTDMEHGKVLIDTINIIIVLLNF
ncbi:MAG: hypothetical protein AB1478_10540, partial [Nitrospirota bacterium]